MNVLDHEEKENKEFLFPEDDFIKHRRRPSTIIESLADSDGNSTPFEVK